MEFTDAKDILGITGDQYDTYLSITVPLYIDYAKDYTNNAFLDENGVEQLPGAVKVFVAKACEYGMNKSGLESRKMGSVTYDYQTDFPKSMMKLLKPYKRVRFS